MIDGTGLSIGATRLAAVVVDRVAVTRAPVLTLYPHRSPELGVPAENPDLTESGLIITDFVDRVGDPVAIVAADGSTHHAEVLLVEALRALLRSVMVGRSAGPVAVSHPGHWHPSTVDALRAGLAGSAEFAGTDGPLLIADALAALTALARDPGVPTRGVIAVCDFGGTGTSLTLVDMARGVREAALAPTVRHANLSGELIDQALLKQLIDGLSEAGMIDLSGTSAIGSLRRLRAQCRTAKEELSTSAVTSLTADLPGCRTDLRITREELDDALRAPLAEFAELIQEELERNGVHPNDLVAVALIGGGARIPAVTTLLSERFRVPVITSAHPELTAAIGAGVQAAHSTVREGVTSVSAAATPAPDPNESPTADPSSSNFGALAWSDADNVPDLAPADPSDYDDPSRDFSDVVEAFNEEDEQAAASAHDVPRPVLHFGPNADRADGGLPPVPRWYRRRFVVAGIVLVGALVVLGWLAILLMRDDSAPVPATTPTSSLPAPTTAATVPPEPPPTMQESPPTVIDDPPAPPRTQAPQPAPAPTQEPPPTEVSPPAPAPEQPSPPSEASPPSPEPPVTEPPVTEPPVTEPPPIPVTPPFEGPVITIPGLPPITLFPPPGPPAP